MKRIIAIVSALAFTASAWAAAPAIQGCQVFPANSVWNTPVDNLPLHASSAAWVGFLNSTRTTLHPDWGNVPADFYGIPYVVVPGSQAKLPVTFDPEAASESDAGPYPIPPNPPIEGGPASSGDRHILMLDKDNCVLYELFSAYPPVGGGNWTAYSGAVFDLKNHALRPDGWTSGDAAGLPILPGLARWEEVAAGEINHALRFTASRTLRDSYIWPARHWAASWAVSPQHPPNGARFRLKSTFNISGFRPDTQVILRALKKYGMIVADNGSSWFISGTTDTGWPDALLNEIKTIPGAQFEVVDTSSMRIDPDSGAARGSPAEDFNYDRQPDLLWRSSTSGNTYLWNMNGTALLSDAFVAGIDPSWTLEGVGDFNGDGKPDLVWRNNANGATFVWYMNGTQFVSDALLFNLDPVWKIAGVADFNKDGKPDFLMRNASTGLAFVWYFNNAAVVGDQFVFTIDPSWKVEGVADISLDGQPDLLFRNTASGLAFFWNTAHSGGATSLAASSPPVFSIDPVWEVVQVADWNADGRPDLVFRNAATGLVFVWYLNGSALGSSAFITQIDPSWGIVPRR